MTLSSRVAAAVLALVGVGCTPKVPVEAVVSPEFAFATVQAVAVLPLFDWRVSLGGADTLTAWVTDGVRAKMPSGRVVAPGEAARLIGTGGLAYSWALFLHDWETRDEPDRTAVMRVADLLGVDLLLVVDLPEVVRQDGSGQHGAAFSLVVARVRGFSGASGVLAWYGSAGIELVASWLEPDRAPGVMDAALPALRAILHEFPRLGSTGA